MNVQYIVYMILALVQGALSALVLLNPTSLHFEDNSYTTNSVQEVQVRLSSAPRGDVFVSVTLEPQSNMFTLNRCNLNFTKDNWNVPQSVSVRSLPLMINSAPDLQTLSARLKFSYDAPAAADSPTTQTDGSMCDRDSAEVQISRIAIRAKTCTSWGDPHYETFDGEAYTVSGVANGAHYLVDSIETTVIDMQYSATPGAHHINKRVAVRHFDSFAVIAFEESRLASSNVAPIDDSKVRVSAGATPDLISIVRNRPGYDYAINLLDGTTITLNAIWWGGPQRWYLNIYVKLPGSYSGRTSGYCGNFDGLKTGVPAASAAPSVLAIDNYFSCPQSTANEPFKGCRTVTKSYANFCSAQKAPVNWCDAFPASLAAIVDEEIIPGNDEATSPSLSAQPEFSDINSASSSLTSRTSSRSYTRKSTAYALPSSISSSSTLTQPSATNDPIIVIDDGAVLNYSACYETIAAPKTVPQLQVDETDVSTYCSRVFQYETCMGSSTAYIQTCNDAALSEVVQHSQDIMNAARVECARYINSMLNSTLSNDRTYARALAFQHDVAITEISCELPITATTTSSVDNAQIQKASSTVSSNQINPTDNSENSNSGSTSADNLSSSSDNQSNIITIGAGSAAAVLVLGGAVVAMLAAARRKSKSKSYSIAKQSSSSLIKKSTTSMHENPVYASMFENPLYGSHESATTDDDTLVSSSAVRSGSKKRTSFSIRNQV